MRVRRIASALDAPLAKRRISLAAMMFRIPRVIALDGTASGEPNAIRLGLLRGLGEVDDVGGRVEWGTRLVEADVAIGADAEDLSVDGPELPVKAVVPGGFIDGIRVGPVWNMPISVSDIDPAKEALTHIVGETLRMVGTQTDVLVEVERTDSREL